MKKNNKKMKNLSESLFAALNFFKTQKLNNLKTSSYTFPLVVGSGNAINTGYLIFNKQAAIFATESNLKKVIKNNKELIKQKIITEAVVISASGEKDSIWELKSLKKIGLKTTLLTCSKNSNASKIADKTIVYNKLPEPYTYNISTYLGMILANTQEKPANIEKFIKTIKLPKNFTTYKAYTFILPDKFSAICSMIEIKRDELFGPRLSLRSFTEGQARHAKFVNPWEKELVISFSENKYYGYKNDRFVIQLPKNSNNGLLFAINYYIIGLIQEAKPDYFRKNIAKYCQDGPKAYGQKGIFQIIVE